MMHTINIEREIRLSSYTPILCCQNASRNSPKFWQYQRCLSVCQWWRRSRTDGNSALSLRIQASPSPMTSRSMRFCSKCLIAGMPTILKVILTFIGNRPNCWLSSVLSSLTDGSNFTILTFTGIRALPRWGSSNPTAFKCGYSSRTSHSL